MTRASNLSQRGRRLILLASCAFWAASCGGGNSSVVALPEPPTSAPAEVSSVPPPVIADPVPPQPVIAKSSRLGGTVKGLIGGGMVLQLNGENDLPVAANGPFQFEGRLPEGTRFEVVVRDQPTVTSLACTIDRPIGVMPGADVTDLKVDCAPRRARFVYTLPLSLQPYLFDDATGKLTPAAGTAVQGVTALAVHPTRPFAWVSDIGGIDIDAFRIDDITGVATGTTSLPSAATPPFQLQVHPNGRFLYGFLILLQSEMRGYAIDPVDGSLTRIADATQPAGFLVRSMGFHPSGRFLYAAPQAEAKVSASAVDATTGALSPVPGPAVALRGQARFLTMDPQGRFVYVYSQAGPSVQLETLSIDPATGALTAQAALPGAGSEQMVAEATGRFLYVAVNSTIRIFDIDASTGRLLPAAVPQVTSPDGGITAMNVDPTGRYLFASIASGLSAHRIDPSNGNLVPLPEPRTAALDGNRVIVFKP